MNCTERVRRRLWYSFRYDLEICLKEAMNTKIMLQQATCKPKLEAGATEV
jgi:hypothetical protein